MRWSIAKLCIQGQFFHQHSWRPGTGVCCFTNVAIDFKVPVTTGISGIIVFSNVLLDVCVFSSVAWRTLWWARPSYMHSLIIVSQWEARWLWRCECTVGHKLQLKQRCASRFERMSKWIQKKSKCETLFRPDGFKRLS